MMDEITLKKAVTQLRNVCSHACEEQERFLTRLLRRNAHTEFGERYGFEKRIVRLGCVDPDHPEESDTDFSPIFREVLP